MLLIGAIQNNNNNKLSSVVNVWETMENSVSYEKASSASSAEYNKY